MKIRIFATLLAICLLMSTLLATSSCGVKDTVGITNAEINEKGELILIYSDGTEQNLGVVTGKDGADVADGKDGSDGADGADGENGTGGSVVINSSGSGATAASAKGLRSAVSIICKFEATVQQGGWRPSSGSTTTKQYSSAGSGVIYKLDKESGDAFIITNYHVVYDASSNAKNGISRDISVYLYGSEIEDMGIEATYVGGSQYYDIAVLRVEDSELLKTSSAVAVTVADSDDVVAGAGAIAIGNAQGLGISTTSGIVSVDSEYITMTAADGKTEVSFRVMRVDTPINSGNSGGGLYDSEGNLIGIVNAKIVYDSVENIGYAIPSNVAISVAENVIDYCFGTDAEKVQRALLGITVTTSDSAAVFDPETGLVRIKETVVIHEISKGGVIEGVLLAGDVLLSATFDGKTYEITRQHHIIDMMLDVRAGDIVTINIIRDGEQKSVSVTITEDCLTEY